MAIATYTEIPRQSKEYFGSFLLREKGNKNWPLATVRGAKRSGPLFRMCEISGTGLYGVIYIASEGHEDCVDIPANGTLVIGE